MQRVVSRRKRSDDDDDSRIEDRKRVLVDGDDENGEDAMMATGP
jgi:serine/threonine/tyrosine-interacting protein